MQFELLHPSDQILMMMERIYEYGMTTTSGGNLSVLDENGDLWITPAGIDKGELTRADMVCVKDDGTIVGKHKPSSEYPFHKLIYSRRADLKAVVHAHPPALVAFSMVRKVPNVHLLPNDYLVCGEVGMAKYGLPGSLELGENIALVFEQGFNTVMLENHGVVVGGENLFEAFQRFETLDYCARLEIQANRIGKPISLSSEHLIDKRNQLIFEFMPTSYSSEEKEARREMCKLIHRSYDQRLFTSTQGTFSQKISQNSFLITPYNMDRKYLKPSDLVRIDNGRKEAGKTPSRSVKFHQHIYETHAHVNSIIIAHPPNVMAFAVTKEQLDSRTIPESYILLRNIPKVPHGNLYKAPESTSALFQEGTPSVIVENDSVIVTGQSLLNTFDRLEVAEYSAKAIIDAKSIGQIVHMEDARIKEIEIAFHLK
ncbi:aldolase [Paenibacillus sp. FSL H8-0548]|uniref:class II aldolase/adducin family protein n=1 Tax=Paenibacillus sp. FSL H8-0548 TaxID=1920422 RepID=UPI00096BD2BF|nr:class II aldolase/adducin family protein [Paenibacillus sp. FSL H8-0548]OMF35981.1 aldolase [Paenibacillus sp. FSL H8-0548]